MLNLNEDQRAIYNMGAEAALKFRADPYRDLYQDVMRVETAEYKLSVGYSDPDSEVSVRIIFKDCVRWRYRDVTMTRLDQARVLRFIAEHPAPRPRCFVDY